ncbi:hypothetical protein GCM10010402_21420 [Actinomadura luteofluorescens]
MGHGEGDDLCNRGGGCGDGAGFCTLGRRSPQDGLAERLHRAGDLAGAVVRADPDDKAELYTKLGLTMTCYPEKKHVEARVTLASTCSKVGVRGGT